MRDLQDFVRREICKISSDANLLPLPWACHRGMQVPCDLWPIHKIKCCLSDIVGVDVMPLAWCILPRGWLYVDDPSILFMCIPTMHPAKDIFCLFLFLTLMFRHCKAALCAIHKSAHILPGGACSPVRVQYDCEIGEFPRTWVFVEYLLSICKLLSYPRSIWLWDRWVSPYLSKSKLSLLIIMISL